MAKLYSERLSQIIQFFWQEVNKRKQGVITLEGLRLATSCVSLMRPVPLKFGESIELIAQWESIYVHVLYLWHCFFVEVTIENLQLKEHS